uniref:sialic acid-binding Ig-like lectin 14 n=1 Tax=Doryrhamphus excisus TaxID=161450 RepID=UPI0025AE267A|nr:sialic acid-binding Ig-like lectin 14 [Doryrhamphus excisus]
MACSLFAETTQDSLMWTLLVFAAMLDGVRSRPPEPTIPDRVLAVAGSCVLVPCSFTPGASSRPPSRKERVDVRMRYRASGDFVFRQSRTAFNSEDAQQISGDFRGRTSLTGQVLEGDCSLKVDRLSVDDMRVYEVSLKTSGDSSWGRARSFTLVVAVTPEAPVISGVSSAEEGQEVTLNCSVSYRCPATPPTLHWRWERGVHPLGAQEVRTLQPDAPLPVLQASLTFRVSHRVKAGLRCELSYAGSKTVVAVKDLRVTFPPRDVTVQVRTLSVQEGGSALLACSCKADPPASAYRWSYTQHGRTVHPGQSTHTIRLYNVTRDTAVRCSVENPLGRAESRPTLLNVQYKPVIQRTSSVCIVERRELSCRCSADSNPQPVLTWNINGTALPPDYNASLTADMLTSTLRGRVDGPQTVTCLALNGLGNDSLTLLQRGQRPDTLLLLCLVVPAAAILASFVLSALVFFSCRKKAGKHGLTRRPVPGGSGLHQERMPLYINCTEVTHVYTNGSYQLVYQNCTPHFVHTTQVRPMGRRGGERRRGGRGGRVHAAETNREVQSAATADPESAIYLEVL